MSSPKNQLQKIYDCIENIEFIMQENNLKISSAIEDKIIKPAISMNIVRIAEQFSKLKDDNEFCSISGIVS